MGDSARASQLLARLPEASRARCQQIWDNLVQETCSSFHLNCREEFQRFRAEGSVALAAQFLEALGFYCELKDTDRFTISQEHVKRLRVKNRTPATGTPATGTPATGTPATGTPATGMPATGTPATVTPPGGAAEEKKGAVALPAPQSFAAELQQCTLLRSMSTQAPVERLQIVGELAQGVSQVREVGDEPPIFFFAFGGPSFALDWNVGPDRTAAFRAWLSRYLLDGDVEKRLEATGAINGLAGCCRLSVLRTEGDGNCLPHAATLAMFGIHDRSFVVRRALKLCVMSLQQQFFERFKLELNQALLGEQTHDEYLRDFQTAFDEISVKAKWLSGFHVFVLAHVLRRAIIVYGPERTAAGKAEYTNDLRGIYLPLLCKHIFCYHPDTCSLNASKQPLMLGFSGSHFSALVFTEGERASPSLIPLESVDLEGETKARKRLPLRYCTAYERQHEREMLMNFLNLETLPNGTLCARLRDEPASRCKSGRMSASLWLTFLEGAKRLYEEPVSPSGVLPPERAPSLGKTRAPTSDEVMEDDDDSIDNEELRQAVALSLTAVYQEPPT